MSRETAYPTELTENLREVAYLPASVMARLEPLLPAGARALDVLCASWREDFAAGRVVEGEGRVSFQVLGCLSDETLAATLKPNANPGKQRWALTYVGVDDFGVLRDVAVGNASAEGPRPAERAEGQHGPSDAGDGTGTADGLDDAGPAGAGSERQRPEGASKFHHIEDWAFVWWPTLLPALAKEALPEKWGFREGGYEYLSNYVTQTFNRLWEEGKVLVNRRGDFAALNTGLVTSSYEEIFLCFVPNRRPDCQAWFYEGLCVPGSRGLGKRLVDDFSPLPEVASYFDDVRDLIYDAGARMYPDYEHILVDNVGRLPESFLREELRDAPEALALLDRVFEGSPSEDELENKAATERQEALCELRQWLGDDRNKRYYNRLMNRVDDAVDLACRRARWNYRTGIPSYYPRTHEMTLLLPLYLEEGAGASVALAVSRTDAGNYQGETILTMRMAYKNARLICRPENDWLCA